VSGQYSKRSKKGQSGEWVGGTTFPLPPLNRFSIYYPLFKTYLLFFYNLV